MLPGDTQTKCITVTADASVASTVKGYAINPVTSTAGLENRVKVTIEIERSERPALVAEWLTLQYV